MTFIRFFYVIYIKYILFPNVNSKYFYVGSGVSGDFEEFWSFVFKTPNGSLHLL